MTTVSVLDQVNVFGLNEYELSELIINESRRGSQKYGFKYGVDVQEMESWLISEIYPEVMSNENLQNIKGIRHIIRLRSVDHMRELIKDNASISMDGIVAKKTAEYEAENNVGFADFGSYLSVDPFENHNDKTELKTFLDTLPIDERQIIELSAGITDSLDDSQLTRVRELINQKAARETNLHKDVNVWFTTHDISDVLGIHRNTINNTLKRSKEKALDFGLYM